MKRSFDDLVAAFRCERGDRKFLVFALCRGDARRLIAQHAGLDEHEVFAERFPAADAWPREDDLEALARADGFDLVGAAAVQAQRPRTDSVDDELELRQEALGHWPGAEVLGVRQLEGVVQVHLLFDGDRHAFWLPDAGEVLVASVDQPAWLAFCEALGVSSPEQPEASL